MTVTNSSPTDPKSAILLRYRPLRVQISDIEPDDENARLRLDESKVKELAESLRIHGQLQPVILREQSGPKKYKLRAGTRRMAAAKILAWTEIDAFVAPADATDRQIAVAALQENVQREDLTTYELAMGCRHLAVKYKMSGAEITKHVGKASSHVNNLLYVVEHLNPVILEQWRAGHPLATTDTLRKISTIKDATGEPDHKGQLDAWKTLIEGRSSAGGAEDKGGGEGGGVGRTGAKKRGRNINKAIDSVGIAIRAAMKDQKLVAADIERLEFGLAVIKYITGARTSPPPGLDIAPDNKKDAKREKPKKGKGKKGGK